MEKNQPIFNKGISTPIGILIIAVFTIIVGGVLIWQYLGVQKEELKLTEVKTPENCNDYEMPMTEEEIEECTCPEGYKKFDRLRGVYCATDSRKPCRAQTDCPKGEHCISSDRKDWFCTGQIAGCYYRNPENPEEPMLCAD